MKCRNSGAEIENPASEGGYARRNGDSRAEVADGMAISFSSRPLLDEGVVLNVWGAVVGA